MYYLCMYIAKCWEQLAVLGMCLISIRFLLCLLEYNDSSGPPWVWTVPTNRGKCFLWVLSLPLILVMFLTIPDCRRPRWKDWFIFTFIMSICWIGIFSYLMVWMITIVGELWSVRFSMTFDYLIKMISYTPLGLILGCPCGLRVPGNWYCRQPQSTSRDLVDVNEHKIGRHARYLRNFDRPYAIFAEFRSTIGCLVIAGDVFDVGNVVISLKNDGVSPLQLPLPSAAEQQ